MTPPRPWTMPELARLRRAYGETPSPLRIWQSGAFPGRTHTAIISALDDYSIHRPRVDAPAGLRRSSTMLTTKQIAWLDRRYGCGRRSEGLRDLIDGAMAAGRTEREKALRARVDAIVAELRRRVEAEPDKLDAVEWMILAIRAIGTRMARERLTEVVLTAEQVSILVDGVVQLLRARAEADVDAEIDEAAQIERELASKPPAILH